MEFYGTEGQMFLSKRGKLEILGERNRKIDSQRVKPRPEPLGAHIQNFFDAIHTGNRPHADIEIGHRSATLGHLANLATRIGRSLDFNPETESIAGDEQAGALLSRKYREEGYWAIPKGV